MLTERHYRKASNIHADIDSYNDVEDLSRSLIVNCAGRCVISEPFHHRELHGYNDYFIMYLYGGSLSVNIGDSMNAKTFILLPGQLLAFPPHADFTYHNRGENPVRYQSSIASRLLAGGWPFIPTSVFWTGTYCTVLKTDHREPVTTRASYFWEEIDEDRDQASTYPPSANSQSYKNSVNAFSATGESFLFAYWRRVDCIFSRLSISRSCQSRS